MTFPTHIVATAGIVENEKDEILLIKKSRNGWVFPGGIVENGENLIEALKREVEEETGILVEVKRLVCISSNTSEYEGYNDVGIVPNKVMFDFVCIALGGELRNSAENTESAWLPKTEVMDIITDEVYRLRFEKYLENKDGLSYVSFRSSPSFEVDVDEKI